MTPTLDTLRAIASLAATFPRDSDYSAIELSFGVSDAATAAIGALDGSHRETRLYPVGYPAMENDRPYAIDSEHVTLGGVSFRAQTNRRPLTAEEAEAMRDRAVPLTVVGEKRALGVGRAA